MGQWAELRSSDGRLLVSKSTDIWLDDGNLDQEEIHQSTLDLLYKAREEGVTENDLIGAVATVYARSTFSFGGILGSSVEAREVTGSFLQLFKRPTSVEQLVKIYLPSQKPERLKTPPVSPPLSEVLIASAPLLTDVEEVPAAIANIGETIIVKWIIDKAIRPTVDEYTESRSKVGYEQAFQILNEKISNLPNEISIKYKIKNNGIIEEKTCLVSGSRLMGAIMTEVFLKANEEEKKYLKSLFERPLPNEKIPPPKPNPKKPQSPDSPKPPLRFRGSSWPVPV